MWLYITGGMLLQEDALISMEICDMLHQVTAYVQSDVYYMFFFPVRSHV